MITEEIKLETKLRWLEYCKEIKNIPPIQEIKLLDKNDSSHARFKSIDLYNQKYILYVQKEIYEYTEVSTRSILFHEFTHLADSIKYRDKKYEVFLNIMASYSEYHAAYIEMIQIIKSCNSKLINKESEVIYRAGCLTLESLMSQSYTAAIKCFEKIDESFNGLHEFYYYLGYRKALQKYNLEFDFNFLDFKPLYMIYIKNISDHVESNDIPKMADEHLKLLHSIDMEIESNKILNHFNI